MATSQTVKSQANFQHVAQLRMDEAFTLLQAKKWDGAYYLAGYAVECALKSCIIKRLMATDAFPEKRFSERCWQHKLDELIALAGLSDQLAASGPLDSWILVKDWSEQSRYEFGHVESEVIEFMTAVSDPVEGVLPWIQLHW